MDEIVYTPEQTKLWEESVKEELEFLFHTLLSSFDPPKPSPLKSIQVQEQEQRECAVKIMSAIQEHVDYGFHCFKEECTPTENEELKKILDMVLSNINRSLGIEDKNRQISYTDCQFLEEIAKRQLIKEHYKQASSMFQLILILNMVFDGAWVGWAIAEQELGHFEVVENIYQMATELLPQDAYIAMFAADFYIMNNNLEKAIALLEKAKEQLILENMENSKSFGEIQKTLFDLKKPR